MDYKEILSLAKPGDFIYMDPPYQGTSHSANSSGNVPNHRYIPGVDFNEFVQELQKLNERGIDFIVSYDEQTGDKKISRTLPDFLNLTHIYINAGISAQSTLNGKKETTYESLYLSKNITFSNCEKLPLNFVLFKKKKNLIYQGGDCMEISEEFKKVLDAVTNRRARVVIDTILEKGYCTTEDLKNQGYEHAPRTARDVRELGILLETFKSKDCSEKSIAAYKFGSWENAKNKSFI